MSSKSKRPGVGIGVYIIKDSKLLMGERIGAHQANMFAAPGGHLEFGETWEECAEREVMEETGIKITNARFLGVTNDVMLDDDRHYITIAIAADYARGGVNQR
ncbi:NUDIX domain-containing protein [Candidatus Saccharibacteria bacterium]|nr:NUDIX domain-containing protein [Candidatus Saccharibacteria bacterium]